MKKIILLFIICLLVTGCGKYSQNSLIKKMKSDFDNCKGYKLSGNLSITNNDDIFNYDVDVSYKKENYYLVKLTNKLNDHVQIILRNDDGVYVITPDLNKSFKFQSDWPYNNSQIYLVQTIINDIVNDHNRKFSTKDNLYVFKSSVNYPNNNVLNYQKVYLDLKGKIKKVAVYDKNGIDMMTMIFDKIDFSPKFSKDEFSIDSIINDGSDVNEEKTANLDDIIYPLFIPSGTKLVDEKKLEKDNGERVILTFDGEKSFLLVEETSDVFNEFTIIPSSGEPYQLMDTMGVVSDNSLSWSSDGIDYYLVSDVMNRNEMIEVAQSIVGTISTK